MVEQEIQRRIQSYINNRIKNEPDFDYDGWAYRESKTKRHYSDVKQELWQELDRDIELRKQIQSTLNLKLWNKLETLRQNIRTHKIFSTTSPFQGNIYVLKSFREVVESHIELLRLDDLESKKADTDTNKESKSSVDSVTLWSKLLVVLKQTINNSLHLETNTVSYYFDQLVRKEDQFVADLIEVLEGKSI